MKFDINTIKHLGVSMYAKLPPVIAELVANSWDANSHEVEINLSDSDNENKIITIKDNGDGMTFDELNDRFLFIGKNRRSENNSSGIGGNGERQVIGRKGIGKLSVFGIANEVIVKTIKDGVKNKFKMSLQAIEEKAGEGTYEPEILEKNISTDEDHGTSIMLKGFKRKSPFTPEDLAFDLAKRFLIFDDDFRVKIIHNEKDPFFVENDMRFRGLTPEFTWNFPNENLESDYSQKQNVIGQIFTTETPVNSNLKGIYLIVRGKLANSNEFYGQKETDYAHEYITGWLKVDFIDENPEEDNISTNRESLNWENESTEGLRRYIQEIISFITKEWREKRREKKLEEIKIKVNIDIPKWIQDLTPRERPLAKKMTDAIIKNNSIEVGKSAELVKHVVDLFKFESFKEIAEDLGENESLSPADIIRLLTEWKLIEAREFHKLALIRIQTIEKFEKFIKENAREIPTMHNFLKSFPWLLDPRIMNFRDEVTYSTLLKEKFPEGTDTPEEDKRMDFLCMDFNETVFIIELKRPNHRANDKTLKQALEYSSFLESKLGNEHRGKKVEVFVICGGIVDVPSVKKQADSLRSSGDVYIRDYYTLLKNARNYHQEFIDKYHELEEITSSSSLTDEQPQSQAQPENDNQA